MVRVRTILVATLLALQTVFSLELSAQASNDGYVVFHTHDTLQAKIGLRFDKGSQTHILTVVTDKTTTYRPDEINGFGIQRGKSYISFENKFLEILVTGEIDLFRHKSDFYVRKNKGNIVKLELKYVIKTINGKTYKQQDTEWVATVAQLFSDCLNNLDQLLLSVKLDERTITNLVKEYNHCTKKPFIEQKKNIPWTHLSYGIQAAFTQSQITFKEKTKPDFLPEKYSTSSLTLGLPFLLSFPRSSERVGIQSEILFTKKNFSERVVNINSIDTRYHDSYIEIYSISTPLMLALTLNKGKYPIFLNAGTNFDFNFKIDSHQFSEIVYANTVEVQPDRDFIKVPVFQMGFIGDIRIAHTFAWCSVGIALRHTISVTPVRVDATNGTANSTSILFTVTRR